MDNTKFLLNLIIAVIISIVGLFIIRYFNISYPISITTTSKSTEMAVVGEGRVDVTPDTAYVDAGITVDNRSTVEEVQKTMNTINDKIINSLRDLGIEKSDIKTSNYSVYPNYTYENGQNKITGYNGNATVQIRVRNTDTTSKIIETATSSGANQIQGVRFVVDKPEIYREEARDKAIQNAKDQADKMAKNLGIKLGKIVNIIESAPGIPSTYSDTASYALKGGGGGGGPVIEQGSQTLTSVVTLYFEKQ